MFFYRNGTRVNSTEIRGVQYVTFSFFVGEETVLDYIGNLIENAFQSSNTDEIAPESLVDSAIPSE